LRYRILSLILALCALSALFGCSKTTEYRDDLPATDLADLVADTLGSDSFAAMKESYLTGAMKLDLILFSEYDVRINAYGADIDEFGIFKTADGVSVKDAVAELDKYLSFRLETWMDEYMPEEKPKLEKAETHSAGNYIMYVILSEENKAAALKTFNDYLKTEG